jgi:hypothetical protein
MFDFVHRIKRLDTREVWEFTYTDDKDVSYGTMVKMAARHFGIPCAFLRHL